MDRGPGRASPPPERWRARAVQRAARVAGRVSRAVGAGAGTSLPGTILQRFNAGFVGRRAARFPDGVIAVSGTNGKTTTASMLSDILRASGAEVATNRSGANLRRGVATALLEAPPSATVGVFEVDEDSLPGLAAAMRPRALVLTNIARDQLDRFGEAESVGRLFGAALAGLDDDGLVVANADDPLLWHAVRDRGAVGFGVDAPPDEAAAGSAEPDACPRCGSRLDADARVGSYLVRARCGRCGWASDGGTYRASVTDEGGLDGISLDLLGRSVRLAVGGVHNAYNAVAAAAAGAELGVSHDTIVQALGSFRPRFGRSEELPVGGRSVRLLLAKNPAGADLAIRQVTRSPDVGAVILAVSDRVADGRDVSWIWDVDVERLIAAGLPVIAGGRRAADVAVRLKYGGGSAVAVEPDAGRALRTGLAAAGEGRSLVALATYTAMLALRQAVVGRAGRVTDAEP